MKKLFLSMMAVAIAACTFTSCEDVPEPYNNPYNYQGTNTKVDPKGDGTLATPFNVAAALAKCEEVGEAGTATEVYATGYITELTEVSTSYGNATFKIADSKDGGDALTVYRAKGFKGENITDENLLHAGDSVVVYGKLVNFKGNTPEFTQGCYLVSINGKSDGGEGGEGGDDPETVGTKEAPKTVAEAIAAINALEANKNTDAKWYIKGKVKTVKTKDADITKYKNIDYTIVDDGATDELTIFRGKYLDNADFTLENKVKEGDEVIVLGNLQKYVKDESSAPVPEVTNNYIVVLNGGGVTPPAPSDFEAGQYLFIYNQNGTYKVGTPVASDKDYGYMLFADAKITENKLDNDAPNLFTFTATEGGFTLQDASSRYYYMDGEHKSFQVSATMPTSNYVWTVSITSDGTATIKNAGTNMTIQYVAKYNEFTATDSGDGLPLLLKPGADLNGGSGDSGQGGGDSGSAGDFTRAVDGETLTLTNNNVTASSNTVTVDFTAMGWAHQTENPSGTTTDNVQIETSAGDGSTTPKYWKSGNFDEIRLYAKNILKITGTKPIAKIVANCTSNNSTPCVGNETLTATASGNTCTITNEFSAPSGGTQLRIKTMVITYAE